MREESGELRDGGGARKRTRVCPDGAKMKKQNDHIKKKYRFTVIGAGILAIAVLAGCGRNSSEEESVVPTVTPAAAPTVSVPAPVPTSNQNQESASGRFTGVMGSEFNVPEGFIQLDESPNIGYQYTFWHPDYEIRIVVYEIAPGYIPEGAYDTDYRIAKNNPNVTYFNEGENWFVQSGYDKNGEEIFYSKESSGESGLKTFWISYPTAKREFGDPITAEFEANFRFEP